MAILTFGEVKLIAALFLCLWVLWLIGMWG